MRGSMKLLLLCITCAGLALAAASPARSNAATAAARANAALAAAAAENAALAAVPVDTFDVTARPATAVPVPSALAKAAADAEAAAAAADADAGMPATAAASDTASARASADTGADAASPEAEPAAGTEEPAAKGKRVDPCALTINFFPTAAEIGEPQLVNNKTCAGNQTCNFPGVWGRANQSRTAARVDSSMAAGLLSVAFNQYGSEKPRLFFTPSSMLLSEGGADITACANARAPASTRRLLGAAASATKYGLARPAVWSYTVSYDGKKPVEGQKIAGKAGELDPAQLAKDGSHCANITITMEGAEVQPFLPGFAERTETTQVVCWHKITTQPKAKLAFDMCTNKKFTINVTGVSPPPLNLTQNGSNVEVDGKQQLLLRPVLHIYGAKNRTLNGEMLKDLEYDKRSNPINYVNKYIMLPANLSSNGTYSFVLDQDSLDEGYYKLSAKVAMVSQFPDIVDLDGRAPVVQADSYGEEVRGSTEYLGVTLVNETQLVGVQKSKTTISEISSDRKEAPIKKGDAVTFTWRFAGIGTERCFHDGVELAECASPQQVQANDVSNGNTQHTFRVEFEDVCGETKEAQYVYTQQGVRALSKIDYIPVNSAEPVTTDAAQGAPASLTTTNAATSAVPASSLAALLLGALLAVLLL